MAWLSNHAQSRVAGLCAVRLRQPKQRAAHIRAWYMSPSPAALLPFRVAGLALQGPLFALHVWLSVLSLRRLVQFRRSDHRQLARVAHCIRVNCQAMQERGFHVELKQSYLSRVCACPRWRGRHRSRRGSSVARRWRCDVPNCPQPTRIDRVCPPSSLKTSFELLALRSSFAFAPRLTAAHRQLV